MTLLARRSARHRRQAPAPARWARTAAVVGLVGLLVSVLLVVTPAGQRLDRWPLRLVGLYYPRAWPVNIQLSHIKPTTMALVTSLVCLVGLARRRVDLTAGAVVALVGANVTTAVVKSLLLHRPDYGITVSDLGTQNTSPSGHTTAAMSFAVALLLTVPRSASYLATAVGSAAVTFAGVGMVLVGAHRPGDVVAGLGVGLVWAAIAVMVVHGIHRRRGRPEPVPPGTLWAHAVCAVPPAVAVVAWIWSHGLTFGHGRVWPAVVDVALLMSLTVGAVLVAARGARLVR